MEFCNLTWVEAREWSGKNTVVVIPTGSTEQHGPHLPLKMDIATADYVARRVCEKNEMLVTPPLHFGYSEIWRHYPGTISFSQATFRAALKDICTSLIRGGFRKIFILNGHNGNLPPIQGVIWELVDQYGDQGIQIGFGTYFSMAKEECDQIGENFRDGTHANEMETSTSLALFPEFVKMDEARKLSPDDKMRKIVNFDEGGIFVNQWPNSKVYPGVYGKPALASAEKGKAYLEAIINKVARILSDFDRGKYNPVGDNGMPRDFK